MNKQLLGYCAIGPILLALTGCSNSSLHTDTWQVRLIDGQTSEQKLVSKESTELVSVLESGEVKLYPYSFGREITLHQGNKCSIAVVIEFDGDVVRHEIPNGCKVTPTDDDQIALIQAQYDRNQFEVPAI